MSPTWTPSFGGAAIFMAIAGESLLHIGPSNAYGMLLIQTIWATTPDLEYGRRRTDIESPKTVVALQERLDELVGDLVRGRWSIPPLVAPPAVAAVAA
jgi:hypothetical protein